LSRAREIVDRLLSHYEMRWRPRTGDPFRGLVRTILSQNTHYINEAAAFKRLEERIGVTPRDLAGAPIREIADAIRPAGMYNQRSLTLKRVSSAVLEKYGGDISQVLDKPFLEARKELMELPGVGPKTADVVLMFEAGKRVIPVDRHIARITKRLELVPMIASYEQVRSVLEEAADPERYEGVHVLLIRFGRETCKAPRPLCDECFLRDLCPYLERKRSS